MSSAVSSNALLEVSASPILKRGVGASLPDSDRRYEGVLPGDEDGIVSGDGSGNSRGSLMTTGDAGGL